MLNTNQIYVNEITSKGLALNLACLNKNLNIV